MKLSTPIVLILLFIAVMVGVAGCGESSMPQQVGLTQNDSGKTVSISIGQKFAVTLHGNGSTGFSWDVVPGSESILAQGATQYVPDSTNQGSTGGGGNYTFTFSAVSQGTTPLKLIYHQAWATGIDPAQTFQVTVIVGN